MKKQSDPKLVPPETPLNVSDPSDPAATLRAPLSAALEPTEITVVLPEAASVETSTLAIPIKELDQAKTADIAPALLPAAKPAPSHPVLDTPRRDSASASGNSLKLWLGVAAFVLMAGGFAAFLLFRPKPAGMAEAMTTDQKSPTPVEAVPPELRSYLDQAKGGDAKAMHLIALMYWNGLNVRQDRSKGLDWYRKAAAAGDTAAQKELAVIEGK